MLVLFWIEISLSISYFYLETGCNICTLGNLNTHTQIIDKLGLVLPSWLSMFWPLYFNLLQMFLVVSNRLRILTDMKVRGYNSWNVTMTTTKIRNFLYTLPQKFTPRLKSCICLVFYIHFWEMNYIFKITFAHIFS